MADLVIGALSTGNQVNKRTETLPMDRGKVLGNLIFNGLITGLGLVDVVLTRPTGPRQLKIERALYSIVDSEILGTSIKVIDHIRYCAIILDIASGRLP